MAVADPDALQLLIVDDVRLYREGLAAILAREPSVTRVLTAHDCASAAAALDASDPDVVLVNVADGSHGLLHAVRQRRPDVAIVAVGVAESEDYVVACAEAGVAGYLLRSEPLEHLLRVVRSVVSGGSLMAPRTAAMLLRRVQSLAAQRLPGPRIPDLTAREDDVFRLLELGLSNQEISERLGIAVRTVKNHVHSILEKLGVHRRGEAVAAFRQQRGQPQRSGTRLVPAEVQARA